MFIRKILVLSSLKLQTPSKKMKLKIKIVKQSKLPLSGRSNLAGGSL